VVHIWLTLVVCHSAELQVASNLHSLIAEVGKKRARTRAS